MALGVDTKRDGSTPLFCCEGTMLSESGWPVISAQVQVAGI